MYNIVQNVFKNKKHLLKLFRYLHNRIALISNSFHWHYYFTRGKTVLSISTEGDNTIRWVLNFHEYNLAQQHEIINDKSISTYLPAAEVLGQSSPRVQAASSVKHYSNILLNYVVSLGSDVMDDEDRD